VTIEVCRFFVPGIPQPGGSKRGFYVEKIKRVVITDANKKAKPWKDTVTAYARESYLGRPASGAIIFNVVYYLPRPRSHFGSGKNANVLKRTAPLYPTKKPDVLKLTRSTEDALTGYVWTDDSMIVDEHTFKRYVDDEHPHPGAMIVVLCYSRDVVGNSGKPLPGGIEQAVLFGEGAGVEEETELDDCPEPM
jgi:Holliday junction resolvase RusA-like endonuclease